MPDSKSKRADFIRKYRERKRQAAIRGKRMRLNHAIGNAHLPFAQLVRHNWEPRVEFRDCKGHIIDFIRRHDEISCVQNYLYDTEILYELSKKKNVRCIIQFCEWMKDKDYERTKEMDEWLVKPPFEIVKVILENHPNRKEKQRRLLHHKFILGAKTNSARGFESLQLSNYKNINLLYGTYNVTYAACDNLESTMEFSGRCHPSVVRSFILEAHNIDVYCSGFKYAYWVLDGRRNDPFQQINVDNALDEIFLEIDEMSCSHETDEESRHEINERMHSDFREYYKSKHANSIDSDSILDAFKNWKNQQKIVEYKPQND